MLGKGLTGAEYSDKPIEGNGAREAFIKACAGYIGKPLDSHPKFADEMLALLWIDGYKLVPLSPEDEDA
jgi:hypothetical protein